MSVRHARRSRVPRPAGRPGLNPIMNPTTRRLLTGLLAIGCALSPAPANAAGVPVSTAPYAQSAPRIVARPGGGAWVAWLDGRSGYSIDVYGAMLDAAGTPSTGGADQGLAFTDITCVKRDLTLVADGTGGAIAAWSDNRCSTPEGFDIFVLRLGADGRPAAGWPANGRNVSAAPDWQVQPALAPDGSGGAFVGWVELTGFLPRVVVHHVLANGTLDPAWPVAGITLAVAGAEAASPVLGPDGAGGFYIAWGDRRDGDLDLRLQRVSGTGAIAAGWPAEAIEACTAPDEQFEPRLIAGVSGVSLAWLDRRAEGTARVYACRFLPSGQRAPGWPLDGVAVAAGGGAQSDLVVARADVGGLRFAWAEDRGLGSGRDVYAQRVDSTGAVVAGWPASGATACAAPGDQYAPSFTPDGAGGAYFTWTDERDTLAGGRDVYVQRLDASGSVAAGWPVHGFALCADAGHQREPVLTGNGRGGAFAVWTDGRNDATTADDIVMREVAPAGPASVGVSGVTAAHHDGQTFVRWNAPPGHGWTYRVYASASPIADEGGLAAATLVGTARDSSASDARLSVLLGQACGYRTEAGGPELDPAGGLFVRTVPAPGASWYAVTAQPGALGEDRTVAAGSNALASAVAETVATPRPVLQRTVPFGGRDVELWTLWTWDEDAPGFPAMANEAGLPFPFGLVRGGSLGPLVLGFHARGGSLFDGVGGFLLPGEWVLALDDRLPNGESTFWFGYHRAYDVRTASSPPPMAGEVVGYTARRVDFLLDWVRRSCPVDTARVYAYGYSMGGMGATQLALRSPAKVAGVMTVIGQFDFSFEADPNPSCWFNPGGPFRALADRIWGPVSVNLPSAPGGTPVFDLLNGTAVAGQGAPGADLPPLLSFNGRNDVNVGWAEKPRFWAAMQAHRRGGWFYWDGREHGVAGASWIPMQTPADLLALRTDRSFPALSNGDADGDPGDGSPASGDSVGTLNGHLEWDVPLEDAAGWSVTLTLRPLELLGRTVPAPESALVDVTPRRLQSFAVAPSEPVPYRVVRAADGAVLARGFAVADSAGALTVAGVRVHRAGTRIELGSPALAGVAGTAGAAALQLACATPVRGGALAAAVVWPAAEESRLELLDVGGRRVATLFAGRPSPGPARYGARGAALAPGLYFLRASCGARTLARRVVVLR